jgi:DNA-binding NtrC family response regulator
MKHPGRLLVVDDNEDILLSSRLLLKQYYSVVKTLNEPGQIEALLDDAKRQQAPFDVVLLDMNFTRDAISGQEGFYWLRRILVFDPSIVVIMMTAYSDTQLVVEAIRAGASDFIAKPCHNEALVASMAAAFKFAESKKSLAQLTKQTVGLNGVLNRSSQPFLGCSAAMMHVFSIIEKVANTNANVLILGQSGTGKELTARAIHNASERANNAFISLDMGTIDGSLFASELFGHKKGAFTDAKSDRVGRFELAKGGSLFLDELGNLPISQQVKLLAALQNRQITPIGSNQVIDTDVRLICATNDNLAEAIDQGRFRQDLLYRVNTIEIVLPPLTERLEDIDLLAEHFLQHFCHKYRRQCTITPSQMQNLHRYHWPGNVRELAHVIERAVILADTEQLDLSAFINRPMAQDPVGLLNDQSAQASESTHFNLTQMEETTIKRALAHYNGNVTKAAKALGLTRGALYRRLEKYEL